jgi:hypothetical protein
MAIQNEILSFYKNLYGKNDNNVLGCNVWLIEEYCQIQLEGGATKCSNCINYSWWRQSSWSGRLHGRILQS